ncbi:MAG TPA: alkaline phosphatase D family protein [Terricaulis sp.]|nr:alkaline phosphatase D family protein [Terricaulis sp.]
MELTRRSLAAAALFAAPSNAFAQSLAQGAFTHGVASGDPLPDRVILWTRFVSPGDGRIAWEVAEDEAFARIVSRGEANARFANDYCVKVDAGGLTPGRPYFYRFRSASGASETGRTITAPREGAERLTIAVFSCANYGWGYFHPYGHAAAREDIDLIIHTGDYIYELPRNVYPSANETAPGRIIDPVTETVTLHDYYQRYAVYHTDPRLLALRRLKPMSAVWDDHEFANNTWRDGAQNHQPATEGDFYVRMAAAAKAYFDWMPIRRPEPQSLRIYRSLDWGDLARIVLIDTRLIGRDQELDLRPIIRDIAQGGDDARAAAQAFRAQSLDDPNRSMLGPAQEAWFAGELTGSKQRGQPWQIVAQQLVVADQRAENITRFLPPETGAGGRAWFENGERLTALGLPWNSDAWAGYPPARTRFLQACTDHASNAVILGGDTHNCWLNNLAAPGANRLAAIEFAGGSVGSPGMERSLRNAAVGEREAAMQAANPQLAFCDVTHRGYGVLSFTRTACEAEWLAFSDITSPQAPAPHITRIASAASAAAGPGGWAL